MKLRHKPTEAEGFEYREGMGLPEGITGGILGYCQGAHKKIFFDGMKAMRESPNFSKVKSHTNCILEGNQPVPIDAGDWIIGGKVVTAEEFEENWEVVRVGRPPKNAPNS